LPVAHKYPNPIKIIQIKASIPQKEEIPTFLSISEIGNRTIIEALKMTNIRDKE